MKRKELDVPGHLARTDMVFETPSQGHFKAGRDIPFMLKRKRGKEQGMIDYINRDEFVRIFGTIEKKRYVGISARLYECVGPMTHEDVFLESEKVGVSTGLSIADCNVVTSILLRLGMSKSKNPMRVVVYLGEVPDMPTHYMVISNDSENKIHVRLLPGKDPKECINSDENAKKVQAYVLLPEPVKKA